MNEKLTKTAAALRTAGIPTQQVNLSVIGLGLPSTSKGQVQIIDPEGMEALTGYYKWSVGFMNFRTQEWEDELELPGDADPVTIALHAIRIHGRD